MLDQDVKRSLREYILREFLPGERPESLQDSTELITRGILDSLATLKLVSYMEERFGISVEPHETDAEYLNSIDKIAELVQSKLG